MSTGWRCYILKDTHYLGSFYDFGLTGVGLIYVGGLSLGFLFVLMVCWYCLVLLRWVDVSGIRFRFPTCGFLGFGTAWNFEFLGLFGSLLSRCRLVFGIGFSGFDFWCLVLFPWMWIVVETGVWVLGFVFPGLFAGLIYLGFVGFVWLCGLVLVGCGAIQHFGFFVCGVCCFTVVLYGLVLYSGVVFQD